MLQRGLVSVIIPTYNSAAYLPQAIASVLEQDFEDREVIVVDDGSTDDTPDAIRPFLRQVRYVRQENGGNAAARNRGVAEARGEWLAFLDADDLWLPGKLSRQLADLGDHPQARWSFTGAEKLLPCGTREAFPPDPPAGELWNSLVRCQPFGASHSGLMVQRSCFNEIGGFDETLRLSVDWDLFIRLAERFELRSLPGVLVVHRLHSANTTKNAELRLSMYLACLRKHRRFFCEQLGMRRQWRRSYGARLYRHGRYRVKAGRCLEALPLVTRALCYGGVAEFGAKIALWSEAVAGIVGNMGRRCFGPVAGSRACPDRAGAES